MRHRHGIDERRDCGDLPRTLAYAVFLVGLIAGVAWAAPIAVRYPEGPAHGFLTLSEEGTAAPIAYGELTQWLDGRNVASELVFRFTDGSLYDQTITFAQRPSFRVVRFRLVQQGPRFPEQLDSRFDDTGAWEAIVRKEGSEDKHAAGRTTIPADVVNGLTTVIPKNLAPRGVAHGHMLSFRPDPVMLDVEFTPEGTDRYRVGPKEDTATRYVVAPRVTGVKGALASVTGKQPTPLKVWIANGKAPTLVRFEGALYLDGPEWRIELAGVRW